MNKTIEKLILLLLFLIVLYYLVTINIIEGKRGRKKRKRRKIPKQVARIQPKNIARKIPKRVARLQPKNIARKIPKRVARLQPKLPDMTQYKMNFLEKGINENMKHIAQNKQNYKNLILNTFSKKNGYRLQGEVDTISDNILNNNSKYQEKLASVNNDIIDLQNQMKIYEKNNKNLGMILNKLNTELETKYVTE